MIYHIYAVVHGVWVIYSQAVSDSEIHPNGCYLARFYGVYVCMASDTKSEVTAHRVSYLYCSQPSLILSMIASIQLSAARLTRGFGWTNVCGRVSSTGGQNICEGTRMKIQQFSLHTHGRFVRFTGSFPL